MAGKRFLSRRSPSPGDTDSPSATENEEDDARRRPALATTFQRLARTKPALYGHLTAAVCAEERRRAVTELCPLCIGGAGVEAADTQHHWAVDCDDVQRESWRRSWVSTVALTVYADTAADGVREASCWALARTLWPALSAGAADGDDSDGHWLDRCGFFRDAQVREAIAAASAVHSAFKKIKPKALMRTLRASMIETAAKVWQERLSRLTALP